MTLAAALAGCREAPPRPQASGAAAPAPARRPNILLVVTDDLGFTDLGAYGSEIRTPVIDGLAASGLKFSRFRASATCSPTRASLMSGTDPHVAGLGNMWEDLAPNQKGRPGYEGHLNDRVAPLPAVLKQAGYRTFMAGKWHLGRDETTSPAAAVSTGALPCYPVAPATSSIARPSRARATGRRIGRTGGSWTRCRPTSTRRAFSPTR